MVARCPRSYEAFQRIESAKTLDEMRDAALFSHRVAFDMETANVGMSEICRELRARIVELTRDQPA